MVRSSYNPRVFFHQIAVGHSGHVIADRSVKPFLLDSLSRDFAELASISHVAFEDFSQHLARALIHLRHARMIINVRVKKFSERGIRSMQLSAVTNQRRLLFTHLIRTFWICLRN